MPTPSEHVRGPTGPRATDHDIPAQLDAVLARAVLCGTLKAGLLPPSHASLYALLGDRGRGVIVAAAALLDEDGAAGVLESFRKLESVRGRNPAALAERYDALFGHAARGQVCPYETEYGGDGPFQQSQQLADISGYFLAFGLQPRAGERPDHLAMEWEFLEFLCRKEAYALHSGNREMCVVTQQAYRSFLRDHVSRFGRAFARSLVDADPGGFYGALAALCKAFLLLETGRLELPAGPQFVPLRSASLDDAPMACGGNQDLIQIR